MYHGWIEFFKIFFYPPHPFSTPSDSQPWKMHECLSGTHKVLHDNIWRMNVPHVESYNINYVQGQLIP